MVLEHGDDVLEEFYDYSIHPSLEQGLDLIYGRHEENGEFDFFVIFETNTASKQPRRKDLTSDLKSVTLITYISISVDGFAYGMGLGILLIWYGEERRLHFNFQVASKQNIGTYIHRSSDFPLRSPRNLHPLSRRLSRNQGSLVEHCRDLE